MQVLALTPRGYCHGVVDALKILRDVAHDPTVKRPIYVLGMVVHNQKIVDDFKALGIETLHEPGVSRLELLDRISEGTVVLTAHGVHEHVVQKAQAKGLAIIDTTCKDVYASQSTIKNYLTQGYTVLFIGKKTHPESETALAYSHDVYVIEKPADIENLDLDTDKIAVTNQTTMSLYDIYPVFSKIQERYPNAVLVEEQCDATKTRQLAVMHQPKDVDHCFVVGDKHSNNSRKLVEVALKQGIPANRIESVEDLDIEYLKTLKKVSVTSGASTPTQLTKEVIDYLITFDIHTKKQPLSRVKTNNLFKK